MCVFKEVGEERDAKRKKGISEKKTMEDNKHNKYTTTANAANASDAISLIENKNKVSHIRSKFTNVPPGHSYQSIGIK